MSQRILDIQPYLVSDAEMAALLVGTQRFTVSIVSTNIS